MTARADTENAEVTLSEPAVRRNDDGTPSATSTGSGGADAESEDVEPEPATPTAVLAQALDGGPALREPAPADSRSSLAQVVPERAGFEASSTTAVSPVHALQRAEILATRGFARIGFGIGFAGALAVLVLPGNPIASYVMLATIVLGTASVGYLYRRTQKPNTFYEGNGVAIAWYIPSLGVCAAVPYFGPFSPVAVVLVLGIYFTSLGKSPRLAFAIFLTSSLVQGACGALVILDWMHPGFIRVDYLPLHVQIVCQVLVQVVFVGTYLIARGHRKSSLTALEELERAVRAVAQREALLEEARDELRRAAGTGRGRFTDQQIGRYHVGDVIGRGAMGEVYEATDENKQQVAIKLLSLASLGDPHHVQRFLRELRTAAAIESPNVVRVIEVGEQPLPYMVMERLRGRDLANILRARRLMAHDRVLDMLRQVGAGISAAGNAGVVHRDLKPQNLFLADSTWKVLDFGVARQANHGETLTAGHIVGTPAYMAPEQARGASVDHRSDLYALAAIAYRALTGHAPFSGGEVVDLLYRVVHTGPRRPSSLTPLPPDIDLVLAIGLAKDPARRFASADELVDAIAAALAGTLSESIRARGVALDASWTETTLPRLAR